MPFIYFILLIATLIKWLLPYIIIGIALCVILLLSTFLLKKTKEVRKESFPQKNRNESNKQQISNINSIIISQVTAGLLNHATQQEKAKNKKMPLNSQIRAQEKVQARERAHKLHDNGQFEEEIELIKKEIESCDLNSSYYRYWTSLLKIRITENEQRKEPHMRSSLISQIIAGLLNHAIQQEKEENNKTLLNLQIKARELAHILHNSGQFEEEIELIKKEIESCDLNSSYYRYWTSLLKIRITENEQRKEPHMRSSLISQIIAGLLNHAIQQEKEENNKTLLNLQIKAQELAHILHNSGQFEEEIEFIKKKIEPYDLNGSYYKYWTSLLKIRITENEQRKEARIHSSLISLIIAGLLNHAIQQEKEENNKTLLNLQIKARELAHILHNSGQFEEEIEFIKKKIESYDLNGSYYKYWTSLLKIRITENEQRKKARIHSSLISQIIAGLLNHAIQQSKKKEDLYKVTFEQDLSSTATQAPSDKKIATYTSKILLDATTITLNKEDSGCALKFYNKPHRQLCRWVTPEESVEVQGFKLIRGNFYIGECFLLPNNIININRNHWSGYKYSYIYGPVLIPNLFIDNIDNKEKQNYVFCSYQNMSSSVRYEYLMWLSGKKGPQDVAIEVLLFYLYGCEIRMFVDPETNSTERRIMIDNILQIYKSMVQSQHNFEHFLLEKFGDFVAYSVIKFFRTEIESFNIKSILKRNCIYRDCFISQVTINKDSLSPEDVFNITYKVYDIEKHVPSAYIKAAKILYINRLSTYNNIYIDKSEVHTTRSINYNNYNCNFYPVEIELPYTIWSIPTGLYNVNSVVNDCYWNIVSTFHLYNKEREISGGKETVMAILLLPQEVIIKDISAIQKVIAHIKKEMCSNQYLIRPIDWLLELFEFKHQNAKNIYQSYIDSIISGLRRMGYGIVPNYEVDIKRFNFGDICVIYKNEEAYLIKRTPQYEIIELFIKLASYVVLMDSVLNEDFDFVEQQVLSYNDTAGNLCHLLASIRWRFSQKKRPIDKQIRNAIVTLTNEQRTLISNALIRLACIDGDVHPKRIEGLKKVLPLLGIEVNIHSQIHRILTDEEGFATIEKKSDAIEFAIDTEIGKENNQIDTNIILNSEKLHIFEQQTKNAQELLSEIFVDEDTPTSQNTIDNPASDKWKDVLTLLLSREKWERKEIENKCQEMGLILGAVLEQINDFAYDKVNDVVVEDDGENIYVTLDYKGKLI